jgi:hypothetical protein
VRSPSSLYNAVRAGSVSEITFVKPCFEDNRYTDREMV